MGEIVKIMLLKLCNNISFDGGEGGIRTPGTVARTTDFESAALNRARPPLRGKWPPRGPDID